MVREVSRDSENTQSGRDYGDGFDQGMAHGYTIPLPDFSSKSADYQEGVKDGQAARAPYER